MAASRKPRDGKATPRGTRAPAARGADKQEAIFDDVLRAETETGATPQKG